MLRPRVAWVAPAVVAREAMAGAARARIPEPMVMDEPASVADYHAAGEDRDVQGPVHELQARSMSRLLARGGTVLDLGTGSGRLAVRLARHRPDARIVAVDLAEEMLATAERLIAAEGVQGRIALGRADMTAFATSAPDPLALLSCVSALHHLPDAAALDRCLAEIAAVRARTGCAVFLFDFERMRDPRSFPALSTLPVGADPDRPVIRDGIASEAAAWTFAELRAALARAGLADLRGARVLPPRWLQAHWCAGRGGGPAGGWRALPLPLSTRLDVAVQARLFPGLP